MPNFSGEQLRDTGFHGVDQVREHNGRWPLEHDDLMSMQAGFHAAFIAQSGQFGHAPQNLRPGQCENIWQGVGTDPGHMVWNAVTNDWMHKEGHRNTLLAENLCKMGIGSHVVDFRNGIYHVVVVFRGLHS